jgi:outer membrane protein assembly factor BamD
MCYYQREEYILAAYEFEYLLKNYATSSFIVQDRYQLAMCYYNLSPKYDLDQTYTHYAINEFQNFLELYPTDKLATDAEARIKELKNKLAFKEFKTGDLYSKMGNYKAAIYYYELVLQDYFDSDYADNALYSKIQMLILRKNYSDARIEIERFERKFPKSNFLSKVSKLKENLPS